MKELLEERNTKGEERKEHRLSKMKREEKQESTQVITVQIIILEKKMRCITLQNRCQMETLLLQGSQKTMELTMPPFNRY